MRQSLQTWAPWGFELPWNFVEAMMQLNDAGDLLSPFMIMMLAFCSLTDSAQWANWHLSEKVSFFFCWSDWFWDSQTLRSLSLLNYIFFLFPWLNQSSFWGELEVDLRNDLTCGLRIEDGVFWIVPLENWPFDISQNDKTWGIVVTLVVMKDCLLTLLLKVCLATLKQMKLNRILVKCI